MQVHKNNVQNQAQLPNNGTKQGHCKSILLKPQVTLCEEEKQSLISFRKIECEE